MKMESTGDYYKSLFGLEGKIALVVGGTSSLGGEIAKALSAVGLDKVIITSRTQEKADKKAIEYSNEFSFSKTEFIGLECEVTSEESLSILANKIKGLGINKIDTLIHAAGGNAKGATIQDNETIVDLDPKALDDIVRLNFQSAVCAVREFVPFLAKAKDASILFFGSEAGLIALSKVMGYSAAKSALHNFTAWLANDCARKIDLYGGKIRVNALVPGFFITDQNRDLLIELEGSYTLRGQAIIDATPLGRFGEPKELVATALVLISPKAGSFITGTCSVVDGGYSATKV